MEAGLIPIEGKIQHYNWGGHEFLPNLLQIENRTGEPYAELWLGAHLKGPATIDYCGRKVTLDKAVQTIPEILGTKTAASFEGKLPYLLKILDVKEMLSIQAHPSKEQAREGFARENRQGIPLLAAHRTYRDDNHKPEIMVALTEFWLLHGFKSKQEIRSILRHHPIFSTLQEQFANEDLFLLYQTIMEMPQEQVDSILRPYLTELSVQMEQGKLHKNQPEFWAARTMKNKDIGSMAMDRGIFSIFLFNLVGLKPGQGIFQAAGIPHAYLEGVNVELMANSDNVFRGGLTYKHIDVPELLKSLVFDEVTPKILEGEQASGAERVFRAPVPDFELSKIDLQPGKVYRHRAASPEIGIVISGTAGTADGKRFSTGKSFLAIPGQSYALKSIDGPCQIFKAYVP